MKVIVTLPSSSLGPLYSSSMAGVWIRGLVRGFSRGGTEGDLVPRDGVRNCVMKFPVVLWCSWILGSAHNSCNPWTLASFKQWLPALAAVLWRLASSPFVPHSKLN